MMEFEKYIDNDILNKFEFYIHMAGEKYELAET